MSKFWEYLIERQKQKTLRKALSNRTKALEAAWGEHTVCEEFKDVAAGINADLKLIKELQEKTNEN